MTDSTGDLLPRDQTPRDQMPSAMPTLQERLQQLRASYAGQLPEKLRAVAQATEQFAAAGEKSCLDEAHRLAHNLAGSGATYGFAPLSRAARDLELHLKIQIEERAEQENTTHQPDTQALLYLQTLREVVTEAQSEYSIGEAAPDSSNEIETPESVAPVSTVPLSTPKKPRRILPTACAERPVYIATRDFEASLEMGQSLDSYGFAVRTFGTTLQQRQREVAAELRAALEEKRPSVLVLDAALEDEARSQGTSFAAMLSEINQNGEDNSDEIPLIFISDRGDMAARLAAVRAGSMAYFVKPVNASELVDWLDSCIAAHLTEAYRVLVVDDDASMNDYVVRVLQDSGMMAQAIRDPLRVIDAINEFRPDLILVDLNMPQCSGQELARVIRQQPDYLGIPIVFLSAETDLTTQFGALSLGGDDFLTKPLQPHHLAQAVAARVQRSRELRALMTRDSLTGLLNHTAIKERLEQELARAHREGGKLSLAMLDIDFFKKINDVHGHPIGDRVIKSLARLLQQRLRQSDLIGRYGGEEFAIILPGASSDEAIRVLEPMREGFSRLRHGTPGHEFSTTFSAGIATFPACETASALTDSADRALYEAKKNGRNRVEVWDEASIEN